MQSVEPVLENAIKTLQKVVDVRGMGKKLLQLDDQVLAMEDPEACWNGKTSYLRPNGMSKEEFEKEKGCKDPCAHEKDTKKEAEEKAADDEKRVKQLEIIEHKKANEKVIQKQQAEEEKANKAAVEGDEALKKEVEGSSSGKVGTKDTKKAEKEEKKEE